MKRYMKFWNLSLMLAGKAHRACAIEQATQSIHCLLMQTRDIYEVSG